MARRNLQVLPPAVVRSLQAAAFTYPEVGATRTMAPDGYHSICERVTLLGADFDQAVIELMSWQVQRRAAFTVVASSPTIEVGAVAQLRLGWGAVALRSPVRVVSVVDEPDRRGFAYGTLPGHPESGEEAFVLERLPDGLVVFEITAFSRPATWWSRLGAPATRLVQRVITRRYLRALA